MSAVRMAADRDLRAFPMCLRRLYPGFGGQPQSITIPDLLLTCLRHIYFSQLKHARHYETF
jgi:hypothetical protein